METIYWIQRLGAIHTTSWIIFGISCIAVIVCIIVLAEIGFDRTVADYHTAIKGFKVSICVFALTLLLGIFIPSEKQLYAIYGIGGTIDYIKSNDTAKQIPDKCINALDAWVDKMITPKKEEEK